MFKYGSFRNFVIKFFVGIVLFIFGLVYLTSLYSFSPNDPGFNQLNQNFNDNDIKNLFGFFGAYLSSYSLIFIGTLTYFLGFFIFKSILNIIRKIFIYSFITIFFTIVFYLSFSKIRQYDIMIFCNYCIFYFCCVD